MPEADALDVILRLQGLRSFVAGTREAAASVRGVGKATEESSLASRKASAAQERQLGMMGLLRKASLGVGAGLLVAGVEGVKMSVNFQAAMERVHTQAGAAQSQIHGLSEAVLRMSGRSTAQGPMALSKGLYDFISVGMKARQAMLALGQAANLADVGQSNLEQTAAALAGAWKSGISGATNFNTAAATVNATVGAGKMTMQDYVEALGTGILPAAKNAGITFKNLGAAVAVLTDENYKGSSATAQLATALHFITDPTSKATKAFKDLHLTQYQLADSIRKTGSLHPALKLLHERLSALRDPNRRAADQGAIFPGGRGRVLQTLLNQYVSLGQKQKQIEGTTKNFGDSVRRTHETASYKIHAAWARVQVALIRFGDMLGKYVVPAIARLLQAGAKLLTWLAGLPGRIAAVVHWFQGLPGPLKLLVSIIASMVGSAAIMFGLLRAFMALRTGILAVRSAATLFFLFMRAAPMLMGPVGIAIFAIITVLLLMVTHWKQTKAALAAVWHWMVAAFHAVVKVLAAAAKWYIGALKAVWTPIFNILTFPIRLAAKLLGVTWHTIGQGATDAMNWIKRAFNNVVSWLGGVIGKFTSAGNGISAAIRSPFSGFASWIAGVFKSGINGSIDVVNFLITQLNSVSDLIKSASNVQVAGVSLSGGGVDLGHIGQIPHMASGGVLTSPGRVMVGERGPELLTLPARARVDPLALPGPARVRPLAPSMSGPQPLDSRAVQAPGPITVHTHVYLDKRKIAEAIGSYTADRLARA